ncbi:MAG: hypothetical protein DPW09_39765 [Anaerolineae bacterium]|nr:hypothetical protein [Anaerolineae bacterium]
MTCLRRYHIFNIINYSLHKFEYCGIIFYTGHNLGKFNMDDSVKTNSQLMDELATMRKSMARLIQRVNDLEAAAAAHQQTEEKLQLLSAERFFQVFLSISSHIYVTEVTENGWRQNLYLSPDVEDLTGYPKAKLMANWSFWSSKIIHPDDRAAAAVQAAQLALGQSSEVEYRLVRADGEIIWVRDRAGVEVMGASKIVYGAVTEITERKRREAALTKLLELSRTLVTLLDPNPAPGFGPGHKISRRYCAGRR